MQHDTAVRRLKLTTASYFIATVFLGLTSKSLSTVLLGILALGLLFVAAVVFYVLQGDEDVVASVERQPWNQNLEG